MRKRPIRRPAGDLKARVADGLHFVFKHLGTIAIVIGAIWAIYQFQESKRLTRVARTGEYITRFEEGDAADARAAIDSTRRDYLRQFNELNKEGPLSPDARRKISASIIEADEKYVVRNGIDALAAFYDGLYFCVQETLCDAQTAKRYFASEDTRDYWEFAQPYMRVRRANNANFAKGFERFAQLPASSSSYPPLK
jgi:hypothetical protein